MRNKISAIIIDENKKEHNYSDIRYNGLDFELRVYSNCDDLLKRINEFRGYDCIITVGYNYDFTVLNSMPFSIRKKWVSLAEFDSVVISNSIVSTFMLNIGRECDSDSKMFSIFTCAHNTQEHMVKRLYNSLKRQTYTNWNWWILDDCDKNKVNNFQTLVKDPRVHIIKNVTDHGNIGMNKHIIASIADGDYLVEVDHDDELTSDCLELLKRAFDTYKDCDFVYSYCYEELGGKPVKYDDGFELGLGRYENVKIEDMTMYMPTTPNVNSLSIRHIVSQPNHVRCWKKEFYHKIGGHNIELSVLDDMDLLIRTFLHGRICKIPKVLYIQHEGDVVVEHRHEGSTTQAIRFAEIQRTVYILKERYDQEIHDRVIELCGKDPYWVGEDGDKYSDLAIGPHEDMIDVNYTLEI